MSKPRKAKEKGAKDAGTGTGRRSLYIGIGAIVLIAIVAVAAVVLFAGEKAANGNSVNVYYTGTFANGTVFDSDVGGTPLTITIGAHRVIPGFENAVIGMRPGETKTVTIPAEQAYGAYNAAYVYVLNRTGTLATMNLTEGETLTYGDASTGFSNVKVLNFTKDKVTIDANSPLAGLPLTFTIQLVSINKATS
jgi:peptidylprolyl isomerase